MVLMPALDSNITAATDVIIYHALGPALEAQVVGRGQRMDRGSLNVASPISGREGDLGLRVFFDCPHKLSEYYSKRILVRADH